jgi:hypothetical protein
METGPSAPPNSNKRLMRSPYALTSQLATTGNGTIIPNVQGQGGAVAAGATTSFPETAFLNSLSIPFWVTHVIFKVTRVAGGNDVDSDYDNVQIQVRDLVRNLDLTKDPVPLSVLGDRVTRTWYLGEGELVIRKEGGGLRVTIGVLPGAVGAPYNVTCAFHGYLEEDIQVPVSYLPGSRV